MWFKILCEGSSVSLDGPDSSLARLQDIGLTVRGSYKHDRLPARKIEERMRCPWKSETDRIQLECFEVSVKILAKSLQN